MHKGFCVIQHNPIHMHWTTIECVLKFNLKLRKFRDRIIKLAKKIRNSLPHIKSNGDRNESKKKNAIKRTKHIHIRYTKNQPNEFKDKSNAESINISTTIDGWGKNHNFLLYQHNKNKTHTSLKILDVNIFFPQMYFFLYFDGVIIEIKQSSKTNEINNKNVCLALLFWGRGFTEKLKKTNTLQQPRRQREVE